MKVPGHKYLRAYQYTVTLDSHLVGPVSCVVLSNPLLSVGVDTLMRGSYQYFPPPPTKRTEGIPPEYCQSASTCIPARSAR
jgi:hypothetical protein